MKEEMEKYGYTENNLYTKEKRVRKIIKRHLFQTTLTEEIWEEAEAEMPVYVTKQLAEQLPRDLYLVTTFDGSRIVFLDEPDLKEKKNAVFGTSGPNAQGIPHLLFNEELK